MGTEVLRRRPRRLETVSVGMDRVKLPGFDGSTVKLTVIPAC